MFTHGRLLIFAFLYLISLGNNVSAQSFEDLVDEMNTPTLERIARYQPLPAEEAFSLDFEQEGKILTLTFDIAPEYHLYKDKFKFRTNATIGDVRWPEPVFIDDPNYGRTPAYSGRLVFNIPIEKAVEGSTLVIAYQGCSPTFCYPPRSENVYISEVTFVGDELMSDYIPPESKALKSAIPPPNPFSNEADSFLFEECGVDLGALNTQLNGETNNLDAVSPSQLERPKNASAAQTQDMLSIAEGEGVSATIKAIAVCLLLGIGLAFTPCVFPMYPILTSVVVGGRKQSKKRTFNLALHYVIGMAIVYAAVGVAVAAFGLQFQQALQHPYSIGAICLLFLALSGSLFGFYNLQMPSWYQTKIATASSGQSGGKALSCFLMGALSGLVASPCTTAPLTGLMLYVAMSGELLSGFVLFFALAFGMGIPLIIFALTGNKLLPKAGAWMDIVKHAMGFILVAVAIYFASRILPSFYIEAAIAMSLFAIGAYSIIVSQGKVMNSALRTLQATAVLLCIVSSVYLGIAAYNEVHPHANASTTQTDAHLSFTRVDSLIGLNNEITKANAMGKPVMLDLYADWCAACKEYEMFVFSNSKVSDSLTNWHLVQIDLTEFNANNDAIQKRLDVIGLPTILFFDTQGKRLREERLSGYIGPDDFTRHVQMLNTKMDSY
jgi:thiol:disulfide interchange protein DsbD